MLQRRPQTHTPNQPFPGLLLLWRGRPRVSAVCLVAQGVVPVDFVLDKLLNRGYKHHEPTLSLVFDMERGVEPDDYATRLTPRSSGQRHRVCFHVVSARKDPDDSSDKGSMEREKVDAKPCTRSPRSQTRIPGRRPGRCSRRFGRTTVIFLGLGQQNLFFIVLHGARVLLCFYYSRRTRVVTSTFIHVPRVGSKSVSRSGEIPRWSMERDEWDASSVGILHRRPGLHCIYVLLTHGRSSATSRLVISYAHYLRTRLHLFMS